MTPDPQQEMCQMPPTDAWAHGRGRRGLCEFAFRNTNTDLCVSVRELIDANGQETTTRDPDNGADQVSKKGFQPFLMGLAKTIRKNKSKKQVELTGYESAQRKRFLRSEAEDAS